MLPSSPRQGADANKKNKGRNIALHYHKGRRDVIEALLPHTKSVDCQDARGSTPLMRAATQGLGDAARALVAAGADVNLQDKWGM